MANEKEYDVMGYWDCPVCQTKKIKGTLRDCPNCGAPIKNLGAMYCEYCGLAVTPINLKVWTLHKFYEV